MGDPDASEFDTGRAEHPQESLDHIEVEALDDADNRDLDEEGSGPPESIDDATNQPISVAVSDNGLQAYAIIRVNRRVANSTIKKALEENGIIYGIDEGAITELCSDEGPRGFPTIVAKGDKQGAGTNAVMHLYFERAPKPTITYDEQGQADYKESGVIQQVRKGALLAKKTPAERGKSGTTVTGEKTSGRMGRDLKIVAGAGTKFEDSEGLRLIAQRGGVVSLHKGNEISVSDEYIIEGDVDFSTGNIKFDGAVVVRGNVLSGFKIVATGDIEIKGVVEDAEIHCGGNLQIRGGFIGKGKGIARVCGETHIRFLENQNVICNNDVYVAEEIVFSNVTCGGELMVKFGKGTIIGGVANARRGIQMKVAGNLHHQKTSLISGQNKSLTERYRLAVDPAPALVIMKDRIQTALDSLVKRKYSDNEELTKEESEAMDYLYKQMAGIDGWAEEIGKIREKMDHEITKLEANAYIRIEQRVYEGVTVTIGNRPRVIDKETGRSEFRLADGEIDNIVTKK
ncbi:hypothetical protein BMS3Bbin04_01938 [bacterium BMS3Bbin04]|nr:hypothetical protein BMS3Bbin04_01938 [bacterium BMS3Bbin04]